MTLTRSGKIVFWGCIWGSAVLILIIFLDPTPENFTLGVSILLSGLYTWLLFLTREHWIKDLVQKPIRNAILIGSLNAAVIETLFLVVEKAFGAAGVAAHPNLALDLLITMPWYVGLVWIFVLVQRHEQFSSGVVLLLGAVYELGGDGIIGGLILPALMGSPPNLLEFLILMPLALFWQFIPVYSSIVLPPAWVLARAGLADNLEKKRWARAFLPLLLLVPFLIYVIVLLSIIDSLGG
jgi:hypothetical protein